MPERHSDKLLSHFGFDVIVQHQCFRAFYLLYSSKVPNLSNLALLHFCFCTLLHSYSLISHHARIAPIFTLTITTLHTFFTSRSYVLVLPKPKSSLSFDSLRFVTGACRPQPCSLAADVNSFIEFGKMPLLAYLAVELKTA